MELRMYAVFDVKSEVYECPIYCHNPGDAARFFTGYLRKQPESNYALFPEDYRIFEVGTFNTVTGGVTGLKHPHMICTFSDLIYNEERRQKNEQ